MIGQVHSVTIYISRDITIVRAEIMMGQFNDATNNDLYDAGARLNE